MLCFRSLFLNVSNFQKTSSFWKYVYLYVIHTLLLKWLHELLLKLNFASFRTIKHFNFLVAKIAVPICLYTVTIFIKRFPPFPSTSLIHARAWIIRPRVGAMSNNVLVEDLNQHVVTCPKIKGLYCCCAALFSSALYTENTVYRALKLHLYHTKNFLQFLQWWTYLFPGLDADDSTYAT